MHTPITVTAPELRAIARTEEPAGYLVIGQGKAAAWSADASAVEPADHDLRAAARGAHLIEKARERGVCDRDDNLLDDGWLLVVGAHVEPSDLDSDPAVLAWCEV